MLSKKKEQEISKKLSYILRHGIQTLDLDCDLNGYVKVNELFSRKLIKTNNIDEIKYIVDSNEKKRFSLILKNNEYYIRANQGHSLEVGKLIDDEVTLEKIDNPIEIFHGTEKKYIDSIVENGLNRGSRKHIHLVSEIEKEKQTSGFKNISNRIIIVNMKKCMEDGMIFYKSENNVILTEGFDGVIDSKYFIDIIEI
jgi:2'-phosphotransferase